jgi:hypothetical protein
LKPLVEIGLAVVFVEIRAELSEYDCVAMRKDGTRTEGTNDHGSVVIAAVPTPE